MEGIVGDLSRVVNFLISKPRNSNFDKKLIKISSHFINTRSSVLYFNKRNENNPIQEMKMLEIKKLVFNNNLQVLNSQNILREGEERAPDSNLTGNAGIPGRAEITMFDNVLGFLRR